MRQRVVCVNAPIDNSGFQDVALRDALPHVLCAAEALRCRFYMSSTDVWGNFPLSTKNLLVGTWHNFGKVKEKRMNGDNRLGVLKCSWKIRSLQLVSLKHTRNRKTETSSVWELFGQQVQGKIDANVHVLTNLKTGFWKPELYRHWVVFVLTLGVVSRKTLHSSWCVHCPLPHLYPRHCTTVVLHRFAWAVKESHSCRKTSHILPTATDSKSSQHRHQPQDVTDFLLVVKT